jgi:hypothetical protein
VRSARWELVALARRGPKKAARQAAESAAPPGASFGLLLRKRRLRMRAVDAAPVVGGLHARQFRAARGIGHAKAKGARIRAAEEGSPCTAISRGLSHGRRAGKGAQIRAAPLSPVRLWNPRRNNGPRPELATGGADPLRMKVPAAGRRLDFRVRCLLRSKRPRKPALSLPKKRTTPARSAQCERYRCGAKVS